MSITTDAHMCELNSYRNLIQQLDQELTKSEISDTKFLCKDAIPQARLEECRRLLDIVEELECQGEVSEGETALIAELMFRIGRNDLVKRLGYGLAGFKKQLIQDGSRLHPFRVLLHEIGEDLVKREREELVFMAKDHLPTSKLEGITTAQGLFVALEKAELLSKSELSILQELIQALNRKDLNDKITRYLGIPVAMQRPILHQNQPILNGGRNPSFLSEDCYKMDARPRGLCLVINNDVFPNLGLSHAQQRQGWKQFKNRRGSHIDAEKLRRTFTNLHFEVTLLKNLDSHNMKTAMAQFALKKNHDSYDCFVCAILSHGSQGNVYGVDGWPVEIRELTNHFKPIICPSLKGKPKLFFIQACQGTDKDEALRIESDAPEVDVPNGTSGGSYPNYENLPLPPGVDMDASMAGTKTIPNEADFLLGFSTVPGFVSFRDIDEGSWYISSLTQMLEKYAQTEDLLSILTKVNHSVSEEYFTNTQVQKINKQVPAPNFTLRKKVFFI